MFGKEKELLKILEKEGKKELKDQKKMSNMNDEQKYAYQNLQNAKNDLKSAKRLMKRCK